MRFCLQACVLSLVVLAVALSVLFAQAPTGAPPAAPAPQKSPAVINVRVPAHATIWIEDQKMTQSGMIRSFQSPPLEPGKTYYYTLKISWPAAVQGQPDTVINKEITVQAGVTSELNLAPDPVPIYQNYPVYPSRPGFFIRRPEGSGYR